jgi:tetratricopeptide (TPR) repeat protein
MRTGLLILFSGIICIATALQAQSPSVQLMIKETTGFLGMGGPRTVNIELSNQDRQPPLNSDNVNGGEYIYFLVTPVEDWRLVEDFIEDELANVTIQQGDEKIKIAWKSSLILGGNNAILLGFPKSLKLNLPFSFQTADEKPRRAEFIVPQELWPGYSKISGLMSKAENSIVIGQFKSAIGTYEQVLSDTALSIFPQYDECKTRRTQCFSSLTNETADAFQRAVADTGMELKSRIALISGFRPMFKFILDSLPRAEWRIGSLDSAVAPIIERSRNSLLHSAAFRDSLQRLLDDMNTRWIIEGSATGKNGYLYVYMIETLVTAFSSINFADSMATELNLKIPEEYQARLEKYGIMESYNTFTRICNERFQTHLPIFPIEFLPNLKRDSISFPLPYYSMLKAVNDFYYGNYASAKSEILRVFTTCYEQDINNHFDMMRVIINIREQNTPREALKLLDEADQLERAKDIPGALDKFQQLTTLIAPNFAYGYFMLGKFYARTGDFIRASYSYGRACELDTMYLSAYRENYNLFLKQSNFKEIINIYTTALSKGNNYWEVNYNLGIAFLGEADPARAIKSFQNALALNKKSYKTNIQIGLAYQSVKNYQKAREYFNDAISLDPTRQEAVDYLTKLNELQRSGK